MSNDFSLIVKLAADTAQFEGAMKSAAARSRQWASEAKAMFETTRTPAERYRDAIVKVSDAYAQGRIDLETYQRSIAKLQDEYSGATAKAEALRAAGQRVFRDMMTPLEQYRNTVADLNRLLAAGAINQQTFNRAKAAATSQLSGSGQNGALNAQATAVFNATRTAGERYGATIQHLNTLLSQGRISQDTYTRAVNQARVAYLGGASPIRQFASSMLGFSTAVGAAVVGAQMAVQAIESLGRAAAAAAMHGLKLAAEFEQAEVAFGTVFKSATAAKQVMAEIQQFAAATPFEFPELKDAAVKLAGFGTSSQQVVPTLKMLGDIAAGTGATVGELAETYGKARVQGRAYTRDVNEFANRGVPIWESLAKMLGTTKDKIHGMVEEGQVGFPELQRALLSLTEAGGMYEGATERQSKTLMGLYSTLRDNINLTLADIGASLVKELSLKDATQDAIRLTGVFKSEMTPVIVELAKGTAMLARAANELGKAFYGVDLSVKGLSDSMYGLHAIQLQAALAAAKLFGTDEEVARIQGEMLAMGARAANLQGGGVGGVKIENDVGKESRDLAEAAASFNAKLKEQMATLGMTADEIDLYRLKQRGLKGEALEQAEALLKQADAQKKLVKAMDEAAEAADRDAKRQEQAEKSLIKSLEKRLAAIRGLKEENALEQHAREFGADSVPEEAKRLAREIEEAEALKKKQKEADDQRKKDAEDARRIIEENRTPYEKYEEQIKRINSLWEQGLLDGENAEEAKRRAERDFINSGPERTSKNKALLRGTSEAFSAINRANDKKKQEKIAEDQLSTLKRQELIQRQQLAAQQNVQRWN